jgi:exosortase F-associated protein
MLNKVQKNKAAIFFLLLLIVLLIAIRTFEKQLFYDPFLYYFEHDYLIFPLPDFNAVKLFCGLLFRFTLNTLISLGIIYLLFKDKQMIVFASFLYVVFFVLLIVAFFSILTFFTSQENFLLFYVRRFLIQPLFLIVFVPAFYFQKKKGN